MFLSGHSARLDHTLCRSLNNSTHRGVMCQLMLLFAALFRRSLYALRLLSRALRFLRRSLSRALRSLGSTLRSLSRALRYLSRALRACFLCIINLTGSAVCCVRGSSRIVGDVVQVSASFKNKK